MGFRDIGLTGAVVGLALPGLLPGCDSADGPPPVVIYVSADESTARPILHAFEERTGIEVLPVFDTEATKTTGLASRLEAERERPRADLFWSSECFRTIQLDADGILAPLSGGTFDTWMSGRPGSWRSDAGTWFAFAPRARVIVYAPSRMEESDVPRTWIDLADPRWRGQVAMADPRFGTTSGHMGAITAYWDAQGRPEQFDAWVEGLAANETAVLTSGNSGVVDGVASGEFALGMTDTDDVWAAQALGRDVALVYPRHGAAGEQGGGTLLVPNTVARIKGGPNPEGAHQLADWLLSTEVEAMLAASNSRNIPLRKDPGTYAVADPLDVDLEESSRRMPEAIDRVRTRLEAAVNP